MANLGRQAAKDLIATLKAATTTRADLRQAIGDALDGLHNKVLAMDAQLAQAPVDFANGKPAQFNAALAALPDVGDPVP